MTLTASHRDLDLDVLEQLSSGAHSVGTTVVQGSPEITGCVVLATCNRFEVYLDIGGTAGAAGRPAPDDVSARARAAATQAIAEVSGMPAADVAASMQERTGTEVAQHLFAVASGLDSMVVGEREVAGQVRRALARARTQGTTSAALERLFQSASRTSRAVGSRTGLGSTGRSVVGVALDLAGHLLADHDVDLAQARVLLVGTGSYAGASLTALRARGVKDVAVHSPSGRAAEFAADRGLEPVAPGDLPAQLALADLVVSCSGALGPVIDAAMVADARAASAARDGRERPVVLVDLALRHDIDPTVARVPGVCLVDLAAVQEHSPATVTPAVEAGRQIVADRAAEFEIGLAEQSVVPTVVALREHVEQALRAEVERTRARGADGEHADAVERSLRRFAAAVLHTPAVRAREHARTGRQAEYRDAVQAVFGLDLAEDGVAAVDGQPDRAPRHRAD
ncbi:MAG: glutamyl-tRNA reductase [Actinotalea sp.]|nr:glutamyl-tRNA reductase [Actinotalea sp.]